MRPETRKRGDPDKNIWLAYTIGAGRPRFIQNQKPERIANMREKLPIGLNEVVAIGLGAAALIRIRRRRQREARERAEAARSDGNGTAPEQGQAKEV